VKRLIAHLIVPAAVAIWAIVDVTRAGTKTLGEYVTVGGFGFLFYASPHLLWFAVATMSRASTAVTHSGFLAANLVLIWIATYPLWGHADPSGLPLQWLAYWPFALGLQLLTVIVVAVANGNWRNETAAG
jgi:hypothetical protein